MAVTELYQPGEAGTLSRQSRICRNAALAAAAAGLIICILLCLNITPVNTTRRLLAVIAVSTIAGWAVILLRNMGFIPLRGAEQHVRHLEEAEAVEYTGVIEKSGQLFRIPGSITVQKVRLTEGEETMTLNLDVRKRALLPDSGTRVRVRCRRSFITAFEVISDE